MYDRIKQARENESGFTLIELLVVIIILGILAAVVVFAVSGMSNKGEASSCRIDTRTLRTAEEAFYANGASPGAYGDMDALRNGGFLSENSKYHSIDAADIVAANPTATPPVKASYKIRVADKQCGTVGNEVGQTAADL
jgi:general secretion pathway protein G